jgi:hypothetical protein
MPKHFANAAITICARTLCSLREISKALQGRQITSPRFSFTHAEITFEQDYDAVPDTGRT